MGQSVAELEARIAALEVAVAQLIKRLNALTAPRTANPTTTQKGTK